MSEISPTTRIAALDNVRGVAVMGILAMNIIGFALPQPFYLNPAAGGPPSGADTASWLVSFILFDGKMRGLFSFLFGASILLVIDRAEASERSAARVHFARMGWLLAFGLVHFYLIWFGDILALYAPVGMIAFLFRRQPVHKLVAAALVLLVVQLAYMALVSVTVLSMEAVAALPGASAEQVAAWNGMRQGFGPLTPAEIATDVALHTGSWRGLVHHMLTDELTGPLTSLQFWGAETLAYMLLGMAALRSGFITGAWSRRAYVRVALLGYGIGVPAYALLGWAQIAGGFDPATVLALTMAATEPIRPLMIAATTALVILLTRRDGALTRRIAAAGRAAFTNYLGTSLLMTFLFYGWGLGLYGQLGRAQLWVPVLAVWALMLLWSKPWLDRFRYGPFEWLWRSLARGEAQPMRR